MFQYTLNAAADIKTVKPAERRFSRFAKLYTDSANQLHQTEKS